MKRKFLLTVLLGAGLVTLAVWPGQPPASNKPLAQKVAGSEPSYQTKEMIAALINMNGHLCASVLSITQLVVGKKTFEVVCIEYRGGNGQVTYILDLSTGIAYRS